jgi:hypothetical protein
VEGGEFNTWVEVIQGGGLVAALLMAIYGNIKGWWISGKQHDKDLLERDKQLAKAEQDRDWWRDFAMRSIMTAETAVRQTHGQQG